MNDRADLSLQDAGKLIADSGITNDVKKSSAEDLRSRNRRGSDDDAEQHSPVDEDEGDEHDADDEGTDDDSTPETEESDQDDAEDDDHDVDGERHPEKEREKTYEVKIDGETKKVTLKELQSGYQRQEDYTRKTQGLTQTRREFVETHTKVAAQYAQRVQHVGKVIGAVRDILVGDIDSAQMQHLRQANPTEWLVARQAMQDRIDAVNKVLGGISTEQERHAAEAAAQKNSDLAKTLGYELETLRKHIPNFDGDGKAKLTKYLRETGFSPEELDQVHDSRMLIIAEKARLYDAFQAEKKSALAKPKKSPPPKAMKPGGGDIQAGERVRTNSKSRQVSDARRTAAKTGNMRDAGRAIGMMLQSGRMK